MSKPLRWGILGTGSIAGKFAGQLGQCPGGELVGVGSRSAESSARFVEQFPATAHAGYEALLADDSVDAVYISLPNAMHHDWAIRALEAGKHVLCEKPIAADAAQAEAMFDAADRAGKLLVEAFMYRCQPAVTRMLAMIREGVIGQVKIVRTHFTFNRPVAADDIRYQAAMAGGALMDVGCYCVDLTQAVTGREPSRVQAVGHRHELGVEDYMAGTLSFDDQTLASFTCGMTVEGDRTSYICGSEGYIEIDTPWFGCEAFTIIKNKGEDRQVVWESATMEVYALEAEAFARAVAGSEGPFITRDDTLGNMRTLDRLREAMGVR